MTLKKIVAEGLLLTVAVASLALSTGAADAAPFHWCPGDPPIMGVTPNGTRVAIHPAWDTSVCHDYGTTGDHVKEGEACVLPQFQWFQCPPGTTPWPTMPVIPNVGE